MQLGFYNDFENVPEQSSRTPAVQSTTFGLRNRLNQDVRTSSLTNTSAAPRTFGLQSRISAFKTNEKLNENGDQVNRSNMSVVSRTFGLISDDGPGSQNYERLDQEFRRNDFNVNRSLMPRSFGLQTKNSASFSHTVTEENLRANEGSDFMNFKRRNFNISSVSRTLDLRSENLDGLNTHNNERLNHDIRSNNYVNSSLMLKSSGLQSRNLTVNPGLLSEGSLRFSQDLVYRNNGMNHSTSRIFGPAAGSSALSVGLQRQDSEDYSDTIMDGGGFKRPVMSRVIRGRNSTLSSRLFHRENTDRHCKDLSNVNGFVVSHISQRNGDTLSRSGLALNGRNNCVDNQSISQSVLSGASAKAQVMNLLENLHYSILNIGPHVTAAALRLEFDKAKQNLENISEMSFAASTWNGDAASVISQSSKSIYPTSAQATTSDTLDGGLLHLKSSTELLQSLISSKESGHKSKTKKISPRGEGENGVALRLSRIRESDEEQNSELVFKKPRAYARKKNTTRIAKVGTPRRGKSSESKATSKAISLKQWYPIAVGSDLALCGVDEQGATVKTDPIKKRVNNRRVELISGLACHLIGSPSTMVSVLPKKIISLLKNGLTDRWRVLQKELLNCQTAEENTRKRISKSPKVTSSPRKTKMTSSPKKTKVRSSPKKTKVTSSPKKMKVTSSPKKTKITSSPKKSRGKVLGAKVGRRKAQISKITSTPVEEVIEVQTRRGRTIKPPGMFWLVPDIGSDEVTSTSTPVAPKAVEESSNEAWGRSIEETPVKRKRNVSRKSPSKGARVAREASRGRKKKSPEKADSKTPEVKSMEATRSESERSKKKEKEEEMKVYSSAEKGKRQNEGRKSGSKRKREAAGDADAVQAKKSKLEKKTDLEITQTSIKVKKRKSIPSAGKSSPKSKGRKPSPTKKKREPVKKKTTKTASESKKESKETAERRETREITECEEDFELKLDDIEIPEIANVSGNPQLSRSQLRLVSMETPPLKYFSNNLKLLSSATPVRSPDWCISQRTESEVKQFQRRREEAFKKKIKVDVKKTLITEKSKGVQSRDVKRVMEWVAEKTVKSPQWSSRVLQYIIPTRKRMEQQADEEEDEDIESEFL